MITPEAFQILTLALALAFIISLLIEMKHKRNVHALSERVATLEREAACCSARKEGR